LSTSRWKSRSLVLIPLRLAAAVTIALRLVRRDAQPREQLDRRVGVGRPSRLGEHVHRGRDLDAVERLLVRAGERVAVGVDRGDLVFSSRVTLDSTTGMPSARSASSWALVLGADLLVVAPALLARALHALVPMLISRQVGLGLGLGIVVVPLAPVQLELPVVVLGERRLERVGVAELLPLRSLLSHQKTIRFQQRLLSQSCFTRQER
jgi:hypothetical protein